MSRPIVVTVCVDSSSESWEPQLPPQPWHSRAGGGAVHSIKPGLPPWWPHVRFRRVQHWSGRAVRWSSCAILLARFSRLTTDAPGMRVGFRQLRTCRRTRPGQLCARSPRPYCAPGYSGNPAFRRPSINSFAFDCPPRAINADIVKAGSISSTRAAASRASASRPRWAKADARQR